MVNTWLTASLWLGLALAGGLVAGWTGISISLVEIVVGVIGGNFLGLATTPWADFLAGFGSILLTFLAGAEVDPRVLSPFSAVGVDSIRSSLWPIFARLRLRWLIFTDQKPELL